MLQLLFPFFLSPEDQLYSKLALFLDQTADVVVSLTVVESILDRTGLC
jgi:hypothetical protein